MKLYAIKRLDTEKLLSLSDEFEYYNELPKFVLYDQGDWANENIWTVSDRTLAEDVIDGKTRGNHLDSPTIGYTHPDNKYEIVEFEL